MPELKHSMIPMKKQTIPTKNIKPETIQEITNVNLMIRRRQGYSERSIGDGFDFFSFGVFVDVPGAGTPTDSLERIKNRFVVSVSDNNLRA